MLAPEAAKLHPEIALLGPVEGGAGLTGQFGSN